MVSRTGGVGHQELGRIEIAVDLGVDLGHRCAGDIPRVTGIGDRLEPERHAPEVLHQVVVVERPEKVRLSQNLLLLSRLEAGDARHPSNQGVGAFDRVVDVTPHSGHVGVVGKEGVLSRILVRGERAGLVGVIAGEIAEVGQRPTVVEPVLQFVVGTGQRRPGTRRGLDRLVVRKSDRADWCPGHCRPPRTG